MSALILFVSGTGFAEVCHYRDSAGVVPFVDDKSEVPEQYRSQATKANTLPEVNRVGRSVAVRAVLVTSKSGQKEPNVINHPQVPPKKCM